MKCPNCPDSKLTLAERQGIEIDYCPDCRGVWLDRGELDKIIERSTQPMPSTRRDDDDWDDDDDKYKYGKKKSKTKSFFGEIFDF